ncbi:preprotein translocase subunit SecB [Candidatus Tenderia electrophaga]|jgi:preprotein translocase subunit SecB|uniref:Protein-export protein SecB n=1 Tax=Candidatus Tenderia electrophaga TaxID=1748243 RepID=A0A0S2THE1_9GAMM|nr:preprotein translocase subunit SecB [Candidatus Tenderia electrophaga]
MAEAENPAQGQFSIQKIYTKDVSFETPNSPAIFAEQKWEPEVNVQLNSRAGKMENNMHEVVLSVTVTAKVGEQTAYLVEVQQAGVFQTTGFDDKQTGHLLGSFCPNILFPYVRETISDLVTRGGFPQMLLQPVNFDAIYAQHLQQQQAEGQKEVAH